MTVVNAWCGAPTSESFRVVAEVTGSSTRLVVSTSSSFDNPAYFGPVTPSTEGIADLAATGLDASTRYWWAVEDDGVQDETYTGQLPTHPAAGTAASFQVTVAGDAGLEPLTPGVDGSFRTDRISNHTIFDLIRERALTEEHLMLCHLGDLHYYNPGDPNIITADLTGYRRCYQDVLLQPRQHELYRNLPVSHIWDDHDYGRNDSDAANPGRQFAWQVYREREPHYPLASDTEGCHHAFQIGRVLFIAWDFRSFKTPKATVDDSGKTALGAAQKAWTRNLLETTDAEALVVLQQTMWNQEVISGSDSWGGYNTERTELGTMFVELGWADRMIMVGADAHTSAIDSGANNHWGGFPTGLFASLDATPSVTSSGYDQYISNARDQYGIITVDDDGDRILLTMTGYQEMSQLGSWTVTIDTADAEPTPIPVPPPAVAVGTIRHRVHWLGVDDQTGRVIADLPDMRGETSRLLMAYTSSKLTIPLTQSGPGGLPIQVVEQATQPQGCSIVQVVNDLPVWAGRVLVRAGGSGPNLTLGVASSEQYLLQRRVTARSYLGTDRALIATDLLTDAGSTDLGPGMDLEIDVTLTGDAIDRDYLPSDLTTVYLALRELAEAGTLEWTIDLDWADATATVLRRIMRLRPRIGKQTATHPVFDTATGAAYTLTEDFSSARYANVVTAYGDGEGADLPRSDPQTVALSGVPVVEHAMHVRDVTDPVELNAIAAAELARLMHGVELWELEMPLRAYPRLGFDAGLGDAARWRVKGPRHPDGAEGSGRMIGWGLDAAGARWRPQLLDPHETVTSS